MKSIHFVSLLLIVSGWNSNNSCCQVIPEKIHFGSDIPVTSYTTPTVMKSKVAVAGNGWIYLFLRFGDPASFFEQWMIMVSTDEGKSFSEICEKIFYSVDSTLADADFIVTGDEPGNISLFVAEAGNKGTLTMHDAYCLITRFNATGTSKDTVFLTNWGSNISLHLSLACDYRSPDLIYSNPFSIALAWSGSDLPASCDRLNYVISKDAGNTFKSHQLYSLNWPDRVGHISIALGSATDQFKGIFGIAFEMIQTGEKGDICLISNDYDLTGQWTMPVKIATSSSVPAYSSPAISMKQNNQNTGHSSNPFSLIVFCEDWNIPPKSNIQYIYPYESYDWAIIPQPTAGNFIINWIGMGNAFSETGPSICFNKATDRYLLTYATTENNQMIYTSFPINDPGNIPTGINYRDMATYLSWQPRPSIDINPSKEKTCFTWTEELYAIQNTYFDAEWFPLGQKEQMTIESEIFTAYPNPAKNTLFILVNSHLDCELRIIDPAGMICSRKKIHEGLNTVDVSTLEDGIYLIDVTSNAVHYVKKIIIQ